MPRALETNAAIATFLQIGGVLRPGPDYDVRMPALLRAVTLDEVNAVARRAHRSRRARRSSSQDLTKKRESGHLVIWLSGQ